MNILKKRLLKQNLSAEIKSVKFFNAPQLFSALTYINKKDYSIKICKNSSISSMSHILRNNQNSIYAKISMKSFSQNSTFY